MPSANVKLNKEIKTFRVKRMLEHLNINAADDGAATTDNRNRSASAPASPARIRSGSTKKLVRKNVYVAQHHFHPEVLQEYMINTGNSGAIDFITEEFVKRTNLLNNGYTDEDRYTGPMSGDMVTCFVPVPSYSLENANRDYVLASNRHRLLKQVRDPTW